MNAGHGDVPLRNCASAAPAGGSSRFTDSVMMSKDALAGGIVAMEGRDRVGGQVPRRASKV